jgi:hypothetical protein
MSGGIVVVVEEGVVVDAVVVVDGSVVVDASLVVVSSSELVVAAVVLVGSVVVSNASSFPPRERSSRSTRTAINKPPTMPRAIARTRDFCSAMETAQGTSYRFPATGSR